MKLGLISCAVLLCALPASGDRAIVLSAPVINVLTPIDSMPSKAVLDHAFGGSEEAAFAKLLEIARDPTVDLGVVLHAIRALPAYCPAPQVCGKDVLAHDELVSLVESFQSSQRTSQDLLRLRAAAEALGVTRSGLASDVETLRPLLTNPSRDMRATVVRALRNICNRAALGPLNDLLIYEPTKQVQLAITAALPDLARCPN